MRTNCGKWNEAQLIQDNQFVSESGGDEFGQPVFFLGQAQFVDQGGHVVEPNPMFLSTRFNGQADRYMTFAQAGVTDQDNGFDTVNVLSAGQVENTLLVQLRDSAEIKICQFFEENCTDGEDNNRTVDGTQVAKAIEPKD